MGRKTEKGKEKHKNVKKDGGERQKRDKRNRQTERKKE